MKFFHRIFLAPISDMSNGARLRWAMWRSLRGSESSVSAAPPSGGKVLAGSPEVTRILTQAWLCFSQSSGVAPFRSTSLAISACFSPPNTASTLKRKPATSVLCARSRYCS